MNDLSVVLRTLHAGTRKLHLVVAEHGLVRYPRVHAAPHLFAVRHRLPEVPENLCLGTVRIISKIFEARLVILQKVINTI